MKRLFCFLFLLGLVIGGILLHHEIFATEAQNHEYHGADSIFQAEGIAIFWAILKGKDDESSLVYINLIRPEEAGSQFHKYSVLAVDPFSKKQEWVHEGKEFEENTLLTLNRASFRDMTERRFFFYKGDDETYVAEKPDMTVYYLSIPDTAPEFLKEDHIKKYFNSARERLRVKN